MKQKPMYLNVLTMRFPITAWASIFHRISGVVIFLLSPFMLYLLYWSLISDVAFSQVKQVVHQPFWFVILWFFLLAVIYHSWAGVRHLIMDMGIGDSYKAGAFSSWLVLIATVLTFVLLGARLW